MFVGGCLRLHSQTQIGADLEVNTGIVEFIPTVDIKRFSSHMKTCFKRHLPTDSFSFGILRVLAHTHLSRHVT